MEMSVKAGLRFAGLLVVLASSAFGQALVPDSSVAPIVVRTQADEQTLASYFDMQWSAVRLDAREKLAREGLDDLEELDWEALDTPARADVLLLRHHLEGELGEIRQMRARRAEVLALAPMLELIERLEQQRSDMATLDLEELARQIAAIPDQVKRVRGQLVKADAGADSEKGGEDRIAVSPTVALRAAGAIGDSRRIFRRWYQHYADYEPGFSWWIAKPYERASKALEEYERHLRRELAGQKGNDDDPLVGDPEGRERLLEGLEREMIAYSPEELIAIGERELAWCQQQMKLAAREMNLGDDFHAAIEQVKGEHVSPGEQAGLVTEYAENAIRLMRDRDLVTVPELCAELWRTQMISKSVQRVLPFAAYNNNQVMVAYPTADMETEAKAMSMRGNNEHFTRIVVPHELIPGHHLQGFMADRVRVYRQLFRTPFLVEGWALYWEMMLWDMDYARNPEDRIGMLFWRSHRAARIIVSLKFHLGEMSPEEMIDFLVAQVGHERDGATSEVRRYINGSYGPLYQVGYMIGGLQLRALRHELVDSGRMTEKQFHDAVLQQGPIPIEMIRAQLLDLDLEPGWEASWRFADE